MIRGFLALVAVVLVVQACGRDDKTQAKSGAMICNDPAIQGSVIPSINSTVAGCGIENPVRVTAVAGVTLSQAATIDCETAQALGKWVTKSATPTFADRGGLEQLQVAAHYACRPRNNRAGAKISEHGKGRAIDISGFTMKTGETITVLKGWNSKDGQRLRALWRTACGPFGTVLGPNSDRYHLDHFHFDTARYRSGSYCR